MQDVQIIDRGRGPEIAGTRITVYHIWEFHRAGDSRDDIALTFDLSSRQVQAAVDYIAAHRNEVEREYAKIQERIGQGNSDWVENQLNQNREKLQKRLGEKGKQLA
ncbi:MAG: DUF433 domain-containing protein [Planctomycetes bacterium]|nr:DUF433 domain-containing protein [Planctomycetota bacterium]MBL7039161.1 DUF433 domain-containing protein [Pirellulaceae bacterium]